MQNFEKFKEILLKEKARLEKELSSIGQKIKIGEKEDWIPKYPDLNPLSSEKSEMADEVEVFDNRVGIEQNLEDQLNDVNLALSKIDNNEYGVCEVGGEKIKEDRLTAYPKARTCKNHA